MITPRALRSQTVCLLLSKMKDIYFIHNYAMYCWGKASPYYATGSAHNSNSNKPTWPVYNTGDGIEINIEGMNFNPLTQEWRLNKNFYPINYFCTAELT